MLLEADTPLGTTLSLKFQLELMPPCFSLHHPGQSLVHLLPSILHTLGLAASK